VVSVKSASTLASRIEGCVRKFFVMSLKVSVRSVFFVRMVMVLLNILWLVKMLCWKLLLFIVGRLLWTSEYVWIIFIV